VFAGETEPVMLADYYAAQFSECTEADAPEILEALVRLGEAGIDGLVRGLTSPREAVFHAVLKVLRSEAEHWDNLPDRDKRRRLFSESLLRHSGKFSPTAETEVIRFAEYLLQNRSGSADPLPSAAADRQKTIANCERLIARHKTGRQPSADADNSNENRTTAALNHRFHYPVLLASNERSFVPVPKTLPVQPVQENIPPPAGDSVQRREQAADSAELSRSSHFFPPELQHTTPENIPLLSTVQLMQMLHHPEPAYTESARKILSERDGFTEMHLNLAWRLYHPVPAVRGEIVGMLPHTPSVQPAVWLSVLLNDPDNDVRYRAASFLATAGDPALRRLLVEQCKRDSDERIVNLAEKIGGSVRKTR
jgi:hypothetical protein